MTFKVHPDALRAYADRLAEALHQIESAETYVNDNGGFSVDESGLIGYLVPAHRSYVDALNKMLGHLAAITDTSEASMRQIAASYEHTDRRSAATVDASYPEVARPPISHEAQEGNYPAPRTGW
jgi:uncharacterized protein YukE